MGRRFWAVLVAVVVVAAGGCSAKADPAADGTADPAGLTYGYGPVRDGRYTYLPDVAFLDGGPAAIRAADSTGVYWTVDGAAARAADLAVGKVMYATSRAVGRIVHLEGTGDDVRVALEPVQLTDVFRDAEFAFEREIDPGAFVFQEIPDRPGKESVPALREGTNGVALREGTNGVARRGGAGDVVVAVAPVRLAPGDGKLPPAKKGSLGVSVGDWDVEPYHQPNKLGLKVGHKAGENLKVFVDFALKTNKLKVKSNISIANGVIGGAPTFALEGIEAMVVSLAAGAANGAADNAKVRVEVPVEIVIPIPGEPLVYVNTWKFIVVTALGGNNTTVKAEGEWALDGAIGLLDGSLTTPTLSVTKSIMDSITGISVGVSGLVFAVETKMQFGIGIPAAFTGPFAKLVVDLGITNGSALGAPLARCVSATLDARVGGGYGVSVSSEALDALQKILGTKVKVKLEAERLKSFFHRSQTLPDVPLCRG